MLTRNPIIAALDVPGLEQAEKLAKELAPAVGAFKIGKELFVAAGPEVVKRIRATGASVFLDLKFHDIPNTVARAVASACRLDVQMLTVHASGGRQMMEAAEESAKAHARDPGAKSPVAPLVLGVTVLTSSNEATLAETGCAGGVEEQVLRLATLAVQSGLPGLVCSPREISLLRKVLPRHFQLVTPGIRTGNEPPDDQKRTLTPREAIQAGADWLVVGRPITAAPNPRAAAENILAGL